MRTEGRAATDYRCERKFFISAMEKREVELLVGLHPGMFSEIYHERYINNLYFDFYGMKSYFDSVNGLNRRAKIRIRWYGEMFGFIDEPRLEIKIKEGTQGKKLIFPLDPILLQEKVDVDNIFYTLKKTGIPQYIQPSLLLSRPILLNRFRRKYYLSADRDFRITIDSGLTFYNLSGDRVFCTRGTADMLTTILELKSDYANEDRMPAIAGYFPFRPDKFSKYVKGVESSFYF